MEFRNMYTEHRKNMVIAERDTMRGIIMQITPIDPLKLKPVKITVKNKAPDIVMTPKREKILFARDYFKERGQITVKGLARGFENIRNQRAKPDPQLVKDFKVIISDFVRIGLIRINGFCKRKPRYSKIINPDKIEELRNE